MKNVSLVTWNVAGLRAILKKGFMPWMETYLPDIICLQEIKALKDQLPLDFIEEGLYQKTFQSAEKKGYSGVATLIKKDSPLKLIKESTLGIKKFDCEGRVLISEFKEFILFNCYFPNGSRDHSRVPYKLEFSKKVAKIALEMEKENEKPVIICGDVNTAHKEIDLKNPKENKNSTGFLPIERKFMDDFVKMGFIDCFRHFYPEKKDEYTWWTFRNNCRERNIGWRLDYFFTTERLISKVTNCTHAQKVMGSDHCPVFLTLGL